MVQHFQQQLASPERALGSLNPAMPGAVAAVLEDLLRWSTFEPDAIKLVAVHRESS